MKFAVFKAAFKLVFLGFLALLILLPILALIADLAHVPSENFWRAFLAVLGWLTGFLSAIFGIKTE